MKKNRHKKTRKDGNRENGTRDLVLANKVSGKVHGGLSRIRLSLTFRIALHYCVQLLRSFIPVALILSVLLCVFVSIPVSRKLEQMLPAEPDAETQTISEGYLSAKTKDIPPETDFFQGSGSSFPFSSDGFSAAKSSGFSMGKSPEDNG